MKQVSDDFDSETTAQLRFLLTVRCAWQPESFDLIALIGGTGGGAAQMSFDKVAAQDDLVLSEALPWMEAAAPGSFEDLVADVEPGWRLALLQAYAHWCQEGLPDDQVLIPTHGLADDPTGHFVPMRFRR